MNAGVQVKLEIPRKRVPYLSALEVCSRRGAIQIHVYLAISSSWDVCCDIIVRCSVFRQTATSFANWSAVNAVGLRGWLFLQYVMSSMRRSRPLAVSVNLYWTNLAGCCIFAHLFVDATDGVAAAAARLMLLVVGSSFAVISDNNTCVSTESGGHTNVRFLDARHTATDVRNWFVFDCKSIDAVL